MSDLGAGSKLGRYELLMPIARGGMAAVWAASLSGAMGFRKVVAVKSMLPGLSDDPRFEEMFLAEARFASLIKHPNVASVLDLGEDGGNLYIAMEWVDGETLSLIHKTARASGAGFPIALATRVARAAAAGLNAAHELESDTGEKIELVHRDVSPQNILVSHDGTVKIVDFGVAKATAEQMVTTTDSGHIKGKIAYMSPEQSSAGELDRRTDVFALGLVLYELVTGTHPFRCEDVRDTLQRIQEAPVTPPHELSPQCPPILSEAILKALEKRKEARFQSMTEFGRALERALAELPEGEVDLAEFVRRTVGDRIEQRREIIRQALRASPPAPLSRPSRMPPASQGDALSARMIRSEATASMDEVAAVSTSPSAPPVVVPPQPGAARRSWALLGAGLGGLVAVSGLIGVVLTRAQQAPRPRLEPRVAAYAVEHTLTLAPTSEPLHAVPFDSLADAPTAKRPRPPAPRPAAPTPPAAPPSGASLPTIRSPGF